MTTTSTPNTMSTYISIQDVHKSFGENPVLRGVSLDIEKGEWVALMGPSGCGKSTLLNLLAGLDDVSAGSISIAGQPVHNLSPNQRAMFRRTNVGIVFQAFNLLPHLDVETNIALPLRLGGRSRGETRQRTDELLSRLGLDSIRRAAPSTLSGGQQQRAALARAVVHSPAVLLADEPTGSLDSESTRTVLDLLRAEHQLGQTIVMVTHDYQVAAAADRIVRMLDGRCIDDLSTLSGEHHFDDELIGDTRTPIFQRLVGL
jgi:putative ABC transport system ATP-binding protein